MTLSIRYGQLYYGNLIKLLPRAAYIVVHWKKKLIVRKLFYLPGYHTKIRHVPVSNFMLPTDFLLSFGLRGPSSLKFLGTNYSGVHCDQIGPLNGPVWHFTWDMPHQPIQMRSLHQPQHITLCTESLLRTVSVCTKTTLISGSVGGAGEWSHTCTLGTFLLCPLALSMPTYSNF